MHDNTISDLLTMHIFKFYSDLSDSKIQYNLLDLSTYCYMWLQILILLLQYNYYIMCFFSLPQSIYSIGTLNPENLCNSFATNQ